MADVPTTVETDHTAPPGSTLVVSATPTPVDRLVEDWFVNTFHNQGLPVELFNRFRLAADHLKARLAGKE